MLHKTVWLNLVIIVFLIILFHLLFCCLTVIVINYFTNNLNLCLYKFILKLFWLVKLIIQVYFECKKRLTRSLRICERYISVYSVVILLTNRWHIGPTARGFVQPFAAMAIVTVHGAVPCNSRPNAAVETICWAKSKQKKVTVCFLKHASSSHVHCFIVLIEKDLFKQNMGNKLFVFS